MKNLNLALLLTALTLCSATAQTLTSPKVVSRSSIFTWNDTNVPPAVAYTVYASLAPSTNATYTAASTTNRITLSQLLPASRQNTTYILTVLGWDSVGDSSEPSTNYVVLLPKEKLKGPVNLRVP
jgi:hypothetical protein